MDSKTDPVTDLPCSLTPVHVDDDHPTPRLNTSACPGSPDLASENVAVTATSQHVESHGKYTCQYVMRFCRFIFRY